MRTSYVKQDTHGEYIESENNDKLFLPTKRF